MVSERLPSDALLQHLQSYLGFSYLGRGVSLHGCSSKAQPLLLTESDFTSFISHIHNWVLFLLWLHLFSLSGVFSPLISSSILGTYRPGEFIFQCPIFLPFHTVHGVLKAGMLKWFTIPFSSGPRFVRTLHHDLSVLDGPTKHGHSFTELDKAVVHMISLVSFLWLWFSVCLPSVGEG